MGGPGASASKRARVQDAAGAQDLYRDPLYYDMVYGVRTVDLAFYGDAYVAAAGPVLELGVGSGRVARPAVARGAQVVGVDLNHGMLVRAEAPGLMRVWADMRALPFARRFSLISAPFNVLQHLTTDADLDACLAGVRRCLAPDGRFIFDVFLPDEAWFARDPTRWCLADRYRHPTHDAWYRYAERSAHDAATGINTIWFRSLRDPDQGADFEPSQCPERIEGRLTLRYLSEAASAAALARNGLRLDVAAGDFGGGPVRAQSESLIATARSI